MAHDAFHVSLGRHLTTGFVHRTRCLWRMLGRFESWTLRQEIQEVEISSPVWVSGLARSGSTILLEVLASHPEVASHQYRDFPFLFTPHWWRQILDRQPGAQPEPVERSHGDRLMVTSRSPEAMEEVLWMAFFGDLHDASRSNVLDAGTDNPRFEAFYRDHLRKLMLADAKRRYVAKANYNLTRLEYLLRLFPDARLVIPVRRPGAQIASMRKQHALFVRAIAEHPRARAHLERVGHFEFGPHRSPINAGDDEVVASIEELWGGQQEVRGWARYWAHLYGYVADRLADNEALRRAATVVRYEDLCAHTETVLGELFEHCDFQDRTRDIVDHFADVIEPPSYYSAQFSGAEQRAIEEETAEVAARFGYGGADESAAGVYAMEVSRGS
jgi:hypothetical protein